MGPTPRPVQYLTVLTVWEHFASTRSNGLPQNSPRNLPRRGRLGPRCVPIAVTLEAPRVQRRVHRCEPNGVARLRRVEGRGMAVLPFSRG